MHALIVGVLSVFHGCVTFGAAVGYGGAGAFPDYHFGVLQGSGWDHHGL